jgi:hypothetical protein
MAQPLNFIDPFADEEAVILKAQDTAYRLALLPDEELLLEFNKIMDERLQAYVADVLLYLYHKDLVDILSDKYNIIQVVKEKVPYITLRCEILNHNATQVSLKYFQQKLRALQSTLNNTEVVDDMEMKREH